MAEFQRILQADKESSSPSSSNPFFDEQYWSFEGLEHPDSPYAIAIVPDETLFETATAFSLNVFTDGRYEVNITKPDGIHCHMFLFHPNNDDLPVGLHKVSNRSFSNQLQAVFPGPRCTRAVKTAKLLYDLHTVLKGKWVRNRGNGVQVVIGEEYSNTPVNLDTLALYLRSPEFMGRDGIASLQGRDENTTLVWTFAEFQLPPVSSYFS